MPPAASASRLACWLEFRQGMRIEVPLRTADGAVEARVEAIARRRVPEIESIGQVSQFATAAFFDVLYRHEVRIKHRRQAPLARQRGSISRRNDWRGLPGRAATRESR